MTGAPGSKRPRLAALVVEPLVTAPSIEAAAQRTGVSERTIRRWLADPSFRADLAQAQRRAFGDATGALSAGMLDAVATLRLALTAAPWPVRVNAAARIIELATADRQRRDLTERLDRVEEGVARTPSRWRA